MAHAALTIAELLVDWTGEGQGAWEARLSGGGSGLVPGLLRRHGLPQRLAEALCAEARVPLDRCGGNGGVEQGVVCKAGSAAGSRAVWQCMRLTGSLPAHCLPDEQEAGGAEERRAGGAAGGAYLLPAGHHGP